MLKYQNTTAVQENYDNAIEPENHICYRAYSYKINHIFLSKIFTKFKFVLENKNSSNSTFGIQNKDWRAPDQRKYVQQKF